MLMRLELRKIKHYRSLSSKSPCFSALIFFDGKPIALAKNHGRGSLTDIVPQIGYGALFIEAEEYCKTQKPIKDEQLEINIPFTMESFANQVISNFIHQKEIKRVLKKLDRLSTTKVITLNRHELEKFKEGKAKTLAYSTREFTQQVSDIPRETLDSYLDAIKLGLPEGNIIYNTFIAAHGR